MQSEVITFSHPFAKEIGFTEDKFFGYLWREQDYTQKTVIISFIESLKEGKGNFSRLLDSIWKLGYTVAVPTPSNKMRLILEKKGFKLNPVYDEIMKDTVELWIKEPNHLPS